MCFSRKRVTVYIIVEAHNISKLFNFLYTYHPPKRFHFSPNPEVIMIFLPKTNLKPHIVLICYRIIVNLVIRIHTFNHRCYTRPFRDCLSENLLQVYPPYSCHISEPKSSASIIAKSKPQVRFTKTERFWIDLKRDELLSGNPYNNRQNLVTINFSISNFGKNLYRRFRNSRNLIFYRY